MEVVRSCSDVSSLRASQLSLSHQRESPRDREAFIAEMFNEETEHAAHDQGTAVQDVKRDRGADRGLACGRCASTTRAGIWGVSIVLTFEREDRLLTKNSRIKDRSWGEEW